MLKINQIAVMLHNDRQALLKRLNKQNTLYLVTSRKDKIEIAIQAILYFNYN